MKRATVLKIFLIFLLVCSFIPLVPQPSKANSAEADITGINFRAAAQKENLQMGVNANAEGGLNVELFLNGERAPADVVFIHETSKWMNQKDQKVVKAVRAKEALLAGIRYFEKNGNPDDAYHFIPFDDNISKKPSNNPVIKQVSGLDNIKKAANVLDQAQYNSGGNDYEPPFTEAISLLKDTGEHRKKYIIFLSDGNAHGNGNQTAVEDKIPDLKKYNIVVHSIAFNNSSNNSSHYRFLQNLSTQTKGTVFDGASGSMASDYEQIAQQIDTPPAAQSGEVSVNLDDVKDSKGQYAGSYIDFKGDTARSKTKPFTLNSSVQSIVETFPLVFKKEGTYIFDIKLSADGKIVHRFVKIIVEAAPELGADFTVTPSSDQYAMTDDGIAEGQLDIKLLPTGEVKSKDRKPVDVVFVFDTSASMENPRFGGDAEKWANAKRAIKEAITTFENSESKLAGDRFGFVSFDTNVRTVRPLGTSLPMIRSTVDDLSTGLYTNYGSALEQAHNMFAASANDKHIIFLTDGKPTRAIKTLPVSNSSDGKDYKTTSDLTFDSYGGTIKGDNYRYFYYNNSWNGKTNLTADKVQYFIDQFSMDNTKNLAKDGIKVHTIGFGNDTTQLNYTLLQNLAAATGGTTAKASVENATQILTRVAEKVDSPKLDTEVRVDLSKVKYRHLEGANGEEGKASVPKSSGIRWDQNNIAYLNETITYEVNGGTPDMIAKHMPLEFSAEGTYTFTDIRAYKKDREGNWVQMGIPHAPFTVTVKKNAPLTLRGTMNFEGGMQDGRPYFVDGLVKESGKTTNQFKINYEVTPDKMSQQFRNSGTLNSIKIIQSLPAGISVKPNQKGVTFHTDSNGITTVFITINNINYSSNGFTPSSQKFTLQLAADYAVNTKIPDAFLEYKDSRFADEFNKNTISAGNETINAKVRLREYPSQAYDGLHNGKVEKLNLDTATEYFAGSKIAEASFPNKMKPIKDLEYIKDAMVHSKNVGIKITFYDNDTALAYFTTEAVMKGASTKKEISSGETVYENVEVSLSRLITGDNVKYYYNLDEQQDSSKWVEFNPSGSNKLMILDKLGKNHVAVKALGGFSYGETDAKTVTIAKKITGIAVNPASLNIVKGQSANFTVTLLPADTTEDEYEIEFEEPSIASVKIEKNNKGKADEWSIEGVTAGETVMTVKSKVNPAVQTKVPVSVGEPITGIEITPGSLEIDKGKQQEFTVTLLPKGTVETDYELSFKDKNQNLAEAIIKEDNNGDGDIWVLEGINAGETELAVSSVDNLKITAEAPVKVHEPITDISIIPDNEKIKVDPNDPNKWKVDTGASAEFTVTVLPEETTKNKDYTVELNEEWVTKEKTKDNNGLKDGWSIIGTENGTATMTVTVNSDPSIKKKITIEFTVPFVGLEDVSFTKPHYEFELNEGTDWVPIEDYVKINPEDATDVEFVSVETTNPTIVEAAKNENGEWKVKVAGDQAGYSTVKVTAEQPNKEGNGKNIATDAAVFEVNNGAPTDGGGTGNKPQEGDIDESKW